MNCRKRMTQARITVKPMKAPSKPGNGKAGYADTHGMERRDTHPTPEWEGKGRTVSWDK